MSQLDFEKQFQEQLKGREMEPSKGSWGKLQKRLDGEKTASRSLFWWSGLAASIVGGILVLSLVFQQGNLQDPPAIVDNPSEDIEQENRTQQINPLLQHTEESHLETGVASRSNSEKQEESNTNGIGEPQSSSVAFAEGEDNRKGNTQVKSPSSPEEMTVPAASTGAIAQVTSGEAAASMQENEGTVEYSAKSADEASVLLAEALAEIDSSRKVSEEEIDALLADATEGLFSEKSEGANMEMLAESLLQNVEGELDHSFRAKVFDIIKENFEKTRSAVANRNR